MTRDKLYYYPQQQSEYTKEEAIQIIKRFLLRKLEKYVLPKLEKLLEIAVILICMAMVIALFKGEIIANEAQEILERCNSLETSPYAEQLSIEERAWYYISSLELPKENLGEINLTTENAETIIEVVEVNAEYNPSEEERDFAYRLAFGEAGVESALGQTLVINVAINNMKAEGYTNLIEEFTKEGRYSSVKGDKVYNCGKIVLTENVPQNIKDAVDEAFQVDYSEKMLKEQAEKLGITDSKYWEGGALYFYNPDECSEYQNSIRQNVKVTFRCGDHLFYRYWDK